MIDCTDPPPQGAAPTPIEPDRWYTLAEAAVLLGVTAATVRVWARAGGLPVITVGGVRRVRGDALLARRRTSKYSLGTNPPTAQPKPSNLPLRKVTMRKADKKPKGKK